MKNYRKPQGGRGLRLALSLSLFLGVGLVGVDAALAHSATGTLTVVDVQQHGPSEATFVVQVVFAGDGHDAADAAVSVTVEGPGATGTPVVTPAARGYYKAAITFPTPGHYNLHFSSTNPTGSLTHVYDVAPPATTTTGVSTTTTVPDAAPVAAPVPTTGVTSATPVPLDLARADAPGETSPDSSTSTPWLLAAVVLVFGLSVLAGVLLAPRLSRSTDAG